jgi:alpha-galactosidase
MTQTTTVRAVMGIHPDQFEWTLLPGEKFQAPEAVLAFSPDGMGPLSRNLHSLIRNTLMPHSHRSSQWAPAVPRPILANSWEAMYFNCSEQAIMDRLVNVGANMNIDMVVLDDGWFIGRYNDTRALGDWIVDEHKFPSGLNGLAKKINEKGLKFGIWMEPEMISVDSDLYRAHPDWCLHVPRRSRTEGRNQLVLDLSRSEVQQYVIQSVRSILKSANIEYLKWDFNRHLTEVGNEELPSSRQGELLHRWTIGKFNKRK